MASNEKETFKLDLDAKEFIATAKEAQKSLGEIADVDSLKNLVTIMGQTTLALSTVAVAAYGIKKVLDFEVEAESIKRVNSQFEMLAHNAGVAAGTLREGLERAAGGLVDTDELLGAANKALVTMGGNASKLPELLEIAKNSTLIFGGTLTSNFEALNQAIATGQTRALRQLGLIVDSQEAYKRYANSIGVTVAALSEQEKKTAVLNSVLEKAKSAFAGNKTNLDDTTFAIQRLNVSIKEIKDTFILAFDRTFGPLIKSTMNGLADFAKKASATFAGYFGSVEEQTDHHIKVIMDKLKEAQAGLKRMEESRTGVRSVFWASDRDIEEVKGYIAKLQSELGKLQEKKREIEEAKKDEPTAKPAKDQEAFNKRLLEASKFEASLQELTLARIRSEEEVATSIEQVDFQQGEKIVAMRELRDAKLRELDAQRALQEIKTDEELALKKQELMARTDAEILRVQQETDEKRIASLRRYAQANSNTAAGFTGSMRAASAQATADMQNFSKMGTQFTTAFASNAKQAFKGIGDGSKSAAEAMGGFFLGTVADMAEAYGSELLIAGLWPPNPLALAAGGALMALSGFLRSKAGGTSAGLGAQASTGAASGVQTIPTAGGEIAPVPSAPTLPAQTQRQVAINIMGHYFETPETRRMLVDMIRQEGDASQFTIQQIGQGA